MISKLYYVGPSDAFGQDPQLLNLFIYLTESIHSSEKNNIKKYSDLEKKKSQEEQKALTFIVLLE